MSNPTSGSATLPEWARQAIEWSLPASNEGQLETALRRRIHDKWHELEVYKGFTSCLSPLSDEGKSVVLDAGIRGALVAESVDWKKLRAAVTELKHINRETIKTARKLSTLLQDAMDLRGEHDLRDAHPAILSELMERAGEDRWFFSFQNEREAFFRTTEGSITRPAPDFGDLVAAFAEWEWDPEDVTVRYPFNVAIVSNKAHGSGDPVGSDKLRIFIHFLTETPRLHPNVGKNFELSDGSIASLASVMLDLVLTEDVAGTISKMKGGRMHDASIGMSAMESLRRFGILRF